MQVVPERQRKRQVRVHNMVVGIVSHLTTGCDGSVFGFGQKSVAFCSLEKRGVVIKIFTETKDVAGEVDVAGYLNEGGESEGE